MKQLLISDILNYASKFHSNTELVSCHISGENGIYSNLFYQRYTYEIFNKRCKQFGNMINKLYLQKNNELNQIIIGTLITNNLNHIEICYGTICLGQIFQPINYNLDKENIRYVINHSKVCIIFYERCFQTIIHTLKTKCKYVNMWICIEDSYENLLEFFNSELDWNDKIDEKTIAILLYTNGISSKPLGVQLTHREIILSCMSSISPDAMGISAIDNILSIPNLYSACSWNSIFFIPLTGAKLVLIDDYCIKDSFFDLFCDIIEKEQINTSLGPPTFWSYFLEYIKKNKYDNRFSNLFLSKVITGGENIPFLLCNNFKRYHINVVNFYGMIENNFSGFYCALKNINQNNNYDIFLDNYRPMFGIDIKLDEENYDWNSKENGELFIQGYWINNKYFKNKEIKGNNWFGTNDIVTINKDGFLTVLEKKKDIIKISGIWVSSLLLENIALSHPNIIQCAAINIGDDVFGEICVIVVKTNKDIKEYEIMNLYFDRSFFPHHIIFINEFLYTPNHKIDKEILKQNIYDLIYKKLNY